MVGTRRPVRSTADTPAPVDLIAGEDFTDQGSTNLPNLMRTLVPSYNVSRQPINDEATITRPANLRGLGPDQTLVFVNGKRRHRAATIILLGKRHLRRVAGSGHRAHSGGRAQARRGASRHGLAQYGSDAIAGVINFVLKDGRRRRRGNPVGQTYEGDGTEHRFAGNVGVPLSETGFANLSAQFASSEPTARSRQRPDAQMLIDNGNSHVRQPYAQSGARRMFRKITRFSSQYRN